MFFFFVGFEMFLGGLLFKLRKVSQNPSGHKMPSEKTRIKHLISRCFVRDHYKLPILGGSNFTHMHGRFEGFSRKQWNIEFRLVFFLSHYNCWDFSGFLHPKSLPKRSYRVLKGGVFKGRGNWGTLRIPREDWGTLGNIREY